ncbi:hypothetical protein fh0823_17700 [Francisella halioticida]|nr:MFS transporter [Francisella halioticida]BCD91631.1 hypothetical protein fh0823_17700 [Francisella halioticida]
MAETAPKKIRGGIGALFQLMITVGIFVITLANYLISKLIGNIELSLTTMFIFLLVFSLLMLLFCLFLPKSPKWLMAKNKKPQAIAILNRLWDSKSSIEKEILSSRQLELRQ